jgi:hypothetical protein
MGLEVALGPGAKHGKELVVVADLFDALRLHMRGFLSAAAIGNSPEELTAARWEQLAALGVERVTLLPSGGTAGETITAMGNALHAAAAPAVFVVPPKRSVPGEGPAEAIRALEADDFAAWVRKRQLHGYRYLALAVLAKHRPGSVWTEAARLAALNEAIGIYAAADQRNTAALDAFFVPPILKELEDSPMGAAPRPANAVAANGPTGAPPMPPGGSCPFHGCHKMDCFCWD